jgi:hypothetical protein
MVLFLLIIYWMPLNRIKEWEIFWKNNEKSVESVREPFFEFAFYFQIEVCNWWKWDGDLDGVIEGNALYFKKKFKKKLNT